MHYDIPIQVQLEHFTGRRLFPVPDRPIACLDSDVDQFRLRIAVLSDQSTSRMAYAAYTGIIPVQSFPPALIPGLRTSWIRHGFRCLMTGGTVLFCLSGKLIANLFC